MRLVDPGVCHDFPMAEERRATVAVAAYLLDGCWRATGLASTATHDLDFLVGSLRELPVVGGRLGLVSVEDVFLVLVRVDGRDARYLLSDVTAATQRWAAGRPPARAVLDVLAVPVPAEDDESEPAGDLGVIADMAMPAMDLGALCDDVGLGPGPMLGAIAERLRCGAAFSHAVHTAFD